MQLIEREGVHNVLGYKVELRGVSTNPRFLHTAVGVQKPSASVSRYPFHLLWPANPRPALLWTRLALQQYCCKTQTRGID
jgi:hypothetical protein